MDVLWLPDAAKLLGVDASQVSRYVQRGAIEAVMCGNRMYLLRRDLERVKKLRHEQTHKVKRKPGFRRHRQLAFRAIDELARANKANHTK